MWTNYRKCNYFHWVATAAEADEHETDEDVPVAQRVHQGQIALSQVERHDPHQAMRNSVTITGATQARLPGGAARGGGGV